MKLYILRHATAEDIAPTDAKRTLNLRGELEAERVGRALPKLGAKPTHIFTSPLIRAQQTAEIVARVLQHTGPVLTLEELTNGTPSTMLLHAIKAHLHDGEALLVGHMPSVAGHVGELTGKDKVASFSPASIACLDLPEWKIGAGKLLWMKQYRDLP
ncbi:MAG: Phosphohistidine phosphatase SixA [Verrucomicrobiae bacterium]|nr:Phosphohistidine phosphatase SixA [Verrucomicrobiae bacterium]